MKKYFILLYAVCVVLAPIVSYAQENLASSTDDVFNDARVTVPAAESANTIESMTEMRAFMTFAADANNTPLFVENIIQLTPDNTQDIWTTSEFSYDGVQSGPGGGLDNDVLRIGGWNDRYHSLMQFDISTLPDTVESVKLQLYTLPQEGDGPLLMNLDRITEYWDWRTQGTGRDRERLWWADRPTSTFIRNLPPATTTNSWYSIDITDIYRGWKAGTYPNYGVQLRPTTNRNVMNLWSVFTSSDYTTDLSLRPRLVITTAATPPTITLLGEPTTPVEFGDPFTDPGAIAHDDTDGDLTSHITTTGTVDTHHLGTTTLTYTVTNSAGLSASIERTVLVVHTQFHPELDGYGFGNNSNSPFSIATKREVFDVVFGNGFWGGLRSAIMDAWITSTTSDPFFGFGGNCFGMVLSASKEFSKITQYAPAGQILTTIERPILVSSSSPYFDQRYWNGDAHTVDSTFGHIAADQIAQIADMTQVSIDEFVASTTPIGFIVSVSGMYQETSTSTPTRRSHALLPYRIDMGTQTVDGVEYTVKVYDPNYPLSNEKILELTKSNEGGWGGTFRVDGRNTWILTPSDISVTPITSYVYSPSHSLGIRSQFYTTSWDILLESLIGQKVGYDGDAVYRQIPDITPVTLTGVVAGKTTRPATLFRGNLAQDLRVYVPAHTTSEPSHFFKMLPDAYIDGAVGNAGATVAIAADNSTIIVASTTGAYRFSIGKTLNDEDHTVTFGRNAEGIASVSSYTIDWEDVVTPITEKRDADGDGVFETTKKLTADGTVYDVTPPEAVISFSTTTTQIVTTGTDDLSVPIIATASSTTVITDGGLNSLTLNVARDILEPHFAALVIPSFAYSTGTTTAATTSLRYFHLISPNTGTYSLFISHIKTPTDRFLAVYVKLFNKTYVLESKPQDDYADLSVQQTLLLLRKKVKTYTGLYIPSIRTSGGAVIIN